MACRTVSASFALAILRTQRAVGPQYWAIVRSGDVVLSAPGIDISLAPGLLHDTRTASTFSWDIKTHRAPTIFAGNASHLSNAKLS